MGYIQGINRRQVILFPETVDDYISEDNPVQFIDVFVENLNLKALNFKYCQPARTGRPPYNPADMLKLYIYGYLNWIRSSRRLEKETQRNVELMWLLKKLTPDFKTIADFRKDNKESIKKVSKEFIVLCKKLELFGGEIVGIDGSKFRACNSKKRNFSQAKLEKRIKEIEEKISQYFSELEVNDLKEADVKENNGEKIKAKIEELRERMNGYNGLLSGLKESGEKQVSLTDKDSRAMVNNQKVEVCYNVQMTVDDKHKLIIDHEVTNEVNDENLLSKMGKRAKEVLGVEELEVLADKGYYNAVEIKECVENGITPYIPETKPRVSKEADANFYKSKFKYNKEKDVYECPGGSELSFRKKVRHDGKVMKLYKTKECSSCELKDRCTQNKEGRIIYRWEDEEILEEMRERVKRDYEKVKRRGEIIEHPFGTIKRPFNQGYMLMKGIDKVGAEIGLSVLVYNITRVINIVGISKLIEFLRKSNQLTSGNFRDSNYLLFLYYILVIKLTKHLARIKIKH